MQYFIVPMGFYQKKRQNTTQLTTSGNETVAAVILRCSKSNSSENCVLNPCKIPVRKFNFSKVADQTSLRLQLH